MMHRHTLTLGRHWADDIEGQKEMGTVNKN